jgi:hypothetical protein
MYKEDLFQYHYVFNIKLGNQGKLYCWLYIQLTLSSFYIFEGRAPISKCAVYTK